MKEYKEEDKRMIENSGQVEPSLKCRNFRDQCSFYYTDIENDNIKIDSWEWGGWDELAKKAFEILELGLEIEVK